MLVLSGIFNLMFVLSWSIMLLGLYDDNQIIYIIFHILTILFGSLSFLYTNKFNDDYKKLKERVKKLENKE